METGRQGKKEIRDIIATVRLALENPRVTHANPYILPQP